MLLAFGFHSSHRVLDLHVELARVGLLRLGISVSQEEQFEHLGKVARMPAAYDAFILEVLRRRRYHEVRISCDHRGGA